MKENRKIMNATPEDAEGRHFRSRLEAKAYRMMLDAGLAPEYEAMTIDLVAAFRPNEDWLLDGKSNIGGKGKRRAVKTQRAITYTPDFCIRDGDTVSIIEIKGFSNDVYPYKRKLLLKWLDGKKGWRFYEVHTVSGMKRTINDINERNEQGKK